MWACKKSLAVVKLLKSFGADLEKQSHGHGHGLLSYACKHNRPEVVRWLKTSQSQQRHHLGCSSNFHPGTRAWHKASLSSCFCAGQSQAALMRRCCGK
ncbi:TPA: hypothetical protein ACH3X3_004882 [Trebouxia sp. C0006]